MALRLASALARAGMVAGCTTYRRAMTERPDFDPSAQAELAIMAEDRPLQAQVRTGRSTMRLSAGTDAGYRALTARTARSVMDCATATTARTDRQIGRERGSIPKSGNTPAASRSPARSRTTTLATASTSDMARLCFMPRLDPLKPRPAARPSPRRSRGRRRPAPPHSRSRPASARR